jgi:transposase
MSKQKVKRMDVDIPQPGKRRRYSEKFKEQAVALLLKSGKPAAEVAVLLGVDRTNLQKWKKQFQHRIEARSPEFSSGSSGSQDLRGLQKEIDSLKEMIGHLQTIMKKSFTNIYREEIGQSKSDENLRML